MLTEIDLDAATTRGIISEDQAIRLRNFEAERAQQSLAMAEKFHIFGGLADIMAAAGLAMILFASSEFLSISNLSILFIVFPPLLLLLYNRISPKHRPCLAFVYSGAAILFTCATVPRAVTDFYGTEPNAVLGIVTGLIPASLCALIFWKSCHFPPIPAYIATLFVMSVMGLFQNFSDTYIADNIAMFISAVVVLGLAMWFDLTDVRRETERSQTAFWLHCVAGFFLTKAAFGLITGDIFYEDSTTRLNVEHIIPFVMIISISLMISLTLDRRSLIFGSLVPSLELLTNIGHQSYALLVVGFFLLLFSVFWNRWRRLLLRLMPVTFVAQLPRTEVVNSGQRPTRRHAELLWIKNRGL